MSYGSVTRWSRSGSCSRTGRRASSTSRSAPQAFVVGRGLLRHSASATSGRSSRRSLLAVVIVVAPLRRLAPRPVALPLPAHRVDDREARAVARPARRDPADREAVVRPEPAARRRRHRGRDGSNSRSTASATYVLNGDEIATIIDRDRRVHRAHAAVPVHRARPADAGGGREPAHDRARRHQRRPRRARRRGCCRA